MALSNPWSLRQPRNLSNLMAAGIGECGGVALLEEQVGKPTRMIADLVD